MDMQRLLHLRMGGLQKTTKQDQVVEEVKQQIENIDGAEAAASVDSSSYADDWD